MKGWIIYKDDEQSIRPEAYEIRRFQTEAKKEGIDLRVFKPEQFDVIVTREDRKSILIDGKPESLPDFVMPRMGSGTTYFALAILRHLERLGIYILNTAEAIDTVKDKLYSQQILAQNNLPVPKTMLVRFPVNADLVEKNIGFPVVVKTLTGSQGSGVYLSEDRGAFEDLVSLIHATNPKANLILQEYESNSRGRDLRVVVLGGKIVACMQRENTSGGFKANFSRGAKVSSFPLTPEIEWLATRTTSILGLDISGIDLLFGENHYKICEANSSPGFRGIESCMDVNVPAEIFHYLRVRLGVFKQAQDETDPVADTAGEAVAEAGEAVAEG